MSTVFPAVTCSICHFFRLSIAITATLYSLRITLTPGQRSNFKLISPPSQISHTIKVWTQNQTFQGLSMDCQSPGTSTLITSGVPPSQRSSHHLLVKHDAPANHVFGKLTIVAQGCAGSTEKADLIGASTVPRKFPARAQKLISTLSNSHWSKNAFPRL